MGARKQKSGHPAKSKKYKTSISDLPTELLIDILQAVNVPTRLLLRSLGRGWTAAVNATAIDINLHVYSQSREEAVHPLSTLHISRGFPKFNRLRPPTATLPAFSDHGSKETLWATISIGSGSVDDTRVLLKEVAVLVGNRIGFPCQRVRLIPIRLEVGRPPPYAGQLASPDDEEIYEIQRLSSSLLNNEITIHHPPRSLFSTLLTSTPLKVLDLASIQTPIDIPALLTSPATASLNRLHLRADYRLSVIPTPSFVPIHSLSQTLTHLDLDGPWLTSLVTDPIGFVDILSTLTNLTHLHADFNRINIGTDNLATLIKSLPSLQSFGCLGEINRSFWKSFQKKELNHLTHISVGTKRETWSNASRIHTQMDTLITELPLGILWAAPSLQKISVYLGYHSGATTMDLLLNAIKRIREGGLSSDPELKSGLAAVDVFQAVDVGSVGWLRGWSVVGAGKEKGQGRIRVRVSTGAEMEQGRNCKVWDFG